VLDSYESSRRTGVADAAVLVALDFGERDHDDAVAEFKLLCSSAGLKEAALVGGKRNRPDPAYYAGSGKAKEIAAAVAASGAEVVVFNHILSPAQQRNLEGELKARVIDRTTLILDIFAQRAQSHEGKIQVELAQLRHLATAWCAAGPTWSGKRAVSACAARAKPSLRPTAACSANG